MELKDDLAHISSNTKAFIKMTIKNNCSDYVNYLSDILCFIKK